MCNTPSEWTEISNEDSHSSFFTMHHLVTVNLACQLNSNAEMSVTVFHLQQKMFPDSLGIPPPASRSGFQNVPNEFIVNVWKSPFKADNWKPSRATSSSNTQWRLSTARWRHCKRAREPLRLVIVACAWCLWGKWSCRGHREATAIKRNLPVKLADKKSKAKASMCLFALYNLIRIHAY